VDSPNDDGTHENYILDLERRIELLLTENSELKAKLSAIYTENQELKKRLMLYENPHTQPSRQMIKPKIVNPPGKRGAPMGHKGATKVLGEPDEIIHVSTEKCPECHHILGSPIRAEKKTILDIPPPQKIKVTEYDVEHLQMQQLRI